MQKVLRQAPFIFFAYLLLMSILGVILSSLDCRFFVTRRVLWFTLSQLLPVSLTVVSIVKRKELSKASVVTAQILPLLAIAYTLLANLPFNVIPSSFVAYDALIHYLCAYVVSLLVLNDTLLRGLVATLNTLLLILFIFLFALILMFY